MQFRIFLQPTRHIEARDLRQLDIHQNQVGTVLAGQIERLQAIAGLDRFIARSFDKIAEELHVQLVVFDNHYLLRHKSRPLIPPGVRSIFTARQSALLVRSHAKVIWLRNR
ncbi:hypothetical protein D3C80_1865030 [compost metagenome]